MLALARSQRRYSTIARVALTLSGGFAGSMLAIPIGISLSRQSLMSIEAVSYTHLTLPTKA